MPCSAGSTAGPDPAYDLRVAVPASPLAKLQPGIEIAAGKVRGLGAAIPGLIADGWITARKDGRVVYVQLTAAGVDERARLAAVVAIKPRRPSARPATTSTARLAALETTVADLAARVMALEAHGRPDAPADPALLQHAIVAAVGELDASQRLGGLVPIPDVRAELRRKGVAATDAEVSSALEQLERAWTIDLSVAQSPNAVRDRSAGIERAGRGLLYYVARR
jgi:hypothetical protein